MLHVADLPATDGGIVDWMLIGQVPSEEEGWNYRTGAVNVLRGVGRPGEVAFLDESFGAWPLRKATTGMFADTVLVGRATSNDICIAHSSISKLHARLRLVTSGILCLDAGSSNGTFVNGTAVTTRGTPLTSGDLVRFGACGFQVFRPDHLTELLKRMRKR
jgi:hypothetical protein